MSTEKLLEHLEDALWNANKALLILEDLDSDLCERADLWNVQDVLTTLINDIEGDDNEDEDE
jgi:hypothetical protein